MIEEHRVLPAYFGMTIFTLLAQRSLVHFVFEMTRFAGCLQFDFENCFDMAVCASDRLMRAVKIVVRIPIMIEQGFRPVRVVVAAATVVAVMAAMLVILQMTPHTSLVHFILKWIVRVTIAASQLCVSALKDKLGIPSMVKAGVMPVGGVMAGVTFLSTSTVVCIVIAMTTEACGRRILISRVFVTVKTCGFLVLTEQWVVGHVVVKRRVVPFRRLVTISAVRAKRFFVYIVIVVAIVAGARRVSMQGIGRMAVRACRLQVCTKQLKVRELMIKRCFSQLHDVRISAFVVCVATGTLVRAGVVKQTVIPGHGLYVGRNVFMAIKTEDPLPGAVECFVAIRTFGFKLGMTFDNLARHDESLDLGATGAWKDQC